MIKEAPPVLDPTLLTYESQRDRIPESIALGQALVDELEFAGEPAQHFALRTALSLACLLRPLAQDPDLAVSELLEKTGGPDGNPHRRIDLLAGALIHRVIDDDTNNTPAAYRIEEEARWFSRTNHKQPEHLAVIDPIDETSTLENIFIFDRYTTSAILVTDRQGIPQAAAIASLMDQRLLLATSGNIFRMMYDEKHNTLQHTFNTTRPYMPSRPLRLAMLERRMEAMLSTPFWRTQSDSCRLLPVFGGYALLETLFPVSRPQNHLMPDLHKGQPVYEPFGAIAQAAGLQVFGCDGVPVDFPPWIRDLYERNDGNARIPMVIYAGTEVAAAFPPQMMTPDYAPFA